MEGLVQLSAKDIGDIVYGVLIGLMLFFSIFGKGIKSFFSKIFKHNKKDSSIDKSNTKVINKISPVTTNTTKLMKLIIEAEQHCAYSSIDKLKYVVTNYHQYCIDNKLAFDENIIAKSVEDLIGLTKSVNQRDKDKVEDKPEETIVEVSETPNIHRL